MNSPVDKRGILNEEVFTYRISKDSKVTSYNEVGK